MTKEERINVRVGMYNPNWSASRWFDTEDKQPEVTEPIPLPALADAAPPPAPKANDVQIGGDHYRNKSIQPWDYIAANDLDFFQGSIIAYVTRWKEKGGVEDLVKARHFLSKYIEIHQGK